ncbi:NADH dehydrogenase [Spathaspora sp. JA1]|nr:NADH dehydrogenase [Spathaspora sp. JA1]
MLKAGLNKSQVIKRLYSTKYDALVHNAQQNIIQSLEHNDRSSYLLAQYIPDIARNSFLAIRAFNLEINKISEASKDHQSEMSARLGGGFSTVDLKFKFWSDLISRVFREDPFSEKDLGEPIAILLRDGLRNELNLDVDYLLKFLQTRRMFVKGGNNFQNTNDICSYGEGTYSQLNYLTQGLLLSPIISPSSIRLLELSTNLQSNISDIAAHIGQATAVGSMILGMQYYAGSRSQVTMPIDLMTKFDLSQESLIRLCQGHIKTNLEQEEIREKLKNIVYETAITANDHMLTARDKLGKVQQEIKEIVGTSNDQLLHKHSKNWRKSLPDVIFTPFMVAIPTTLYLNRLEKYDFDVFSPKLQQKEWKLAWTSYRNYHQRII